jgi:hypothetical protein
MTKHAFRSLMILGLAAGLAACSSDADVASRNLSKAADMFEIKRRIVFYNGWTGEYVLQVEGLCSLDSSSAAVKVTCKTGPQAYKKHFLGLGANVTWFAEQIDGATADVFHYRVIFKPSAIIPDVDFRG